MFDGRPRPRREQTSLNPTQPAGTASSPSFNLTPPSSTPKPSSADATAAPLQKRTTPPPAPIFHQPDQSQETEEEVEVAASYSYVDGGDEIECVDLSTKTLQHRPRRVELGEGYFLETRRMKVTRGNNTFEYETLAIGRKGLKKDANGVDRKDVKDFVLHLPIRLGDNMVRGLAHLGLQYDGGKRLQFETKV